MRSFVKTIGTTAVAILSLFTATVAYADVNTYVLTDHKVESGTTARVDEWGICFDVTNGIQNPPIHIPTKTAAEWASFYNNTPPYVSLAPCGGTVQGCTDTTATNYNPSATANDGSCTYAPACNSNAGNICFSTPNVCGQSNPGVIDCGGVCNAITPPNSNCITVVEGCTDASATNYNPNANVDNGSCVYPVGCDTNAGNSCVSGANVCGQTGSGVIQCNGTCSAVTPPNSNCPMTVYGCTDPAANNHNPNANFDDGSCTYNPVCVSNVNQACTSSTNACGDSGVGTIQCDGSCSATVPSVPSNLGASCNSGGNNCGDVNVGSIQCDGSCSASQPADRASCSTCPSAGQPCQSASNACGDTASGTVDGGSCTCNAVPPVTASNFGDSCTSAANACGATSAGTIQCDGSCSASIPANPANLGAPCSTSPNACGAVGAGTIQCDGSCSAGMPSLPASYGNTCTSGANNCGATGSGTIGCSGSCSATTPADVPNVGGGCMSGPNNCGDRGSGAMQCDGSCSATQPGDISGIGGICYSGANNCGDVNTGTMQCGGCDAVTPANRTCGPMAVSGCTDPMADNYDSNATTDDGSCQRTGCTDPMADNYDPNATGGGACTYSINYGCTDPGADNYDPFADADDGSCTYPSACVPQVCNGAAYWDSGSCSCACAPFYHEENGDCVADPMDPCVSDPWLVGCSGDPCLLDPTFPGCSDPCELDPGYPGCQPIDPCTQDPSSPACNPCGFDEVRQPDGSCAVDCDAHPASCIQSCVAGDEECLCRNAGKSWDGYSCCENLDGYGYCM